MHTLAEMLGHAKPNKTGCQLCNWFLECIKAHIRRLDSRFEAMQGGVGSMQDQASHFVRYAPERTDYGIEWYTNETKRLYGVIEKALSDGRQWLAADQYTIADMANFSWMAWHDWAGTPVSTIRYPSLDVIIHSSIMHASHA